QLNGNAFTCKPNYIPAMANLMYLDTLPLCTSGNSQNCPIALGVQGTVYSDALSDCILGTQDIPLQNVQLTLLDDLLNPIQSASTNLNASYFFNSSYGSYT